MPFDKEQVHEIIKSNQDFLYHIVQKYYGSLENYEIEDLYLEIVLAFYNTANYYSDDLKVDFKTLAYQNAIRRLANIYRNQNAYKRSSKNVISYETKVREYKECYGDHSVIDRGFGDHVESKLLLKEIKEEARSFLTKTEYKIFMYYCEGLTVSEIAQKLKVREKTVSNQIYVIKNKIKTAIKI